MVESAVNNVEKFNFSFFQKVEIKKKKNVQNMNTMSKFVVSKLIWRVVLQR